MTSKSPRGITIKLFLPTQYLVGPSNLNASTVKPTNASKTVFYDLFSLSKSLMVQNLLKLFLKLRPYNRRNTSSSLHYWILKILMKGFQKTDSKYRVNLQSFLQVQLYEFSSTLSKTINGQSYFKISHDEFSCC